MNEAIAFVKELGFPVFVAAFLLIRIEPTLRRLEVTLTKILTFLEANHPC